MPLPELSSEVVELAKLDALVLVVLASELDDMKDVVVLTNWAASSSEEPSTADRFPTMPRVMPSSPSPAATSDRKGELLPRLDKPMAAELTPASSEVMLTSSVTAPVVCARRRPAAPPTTEMEMASGGRRDALATALAKESSEPRLKPRVSPSRRIVCRRPTMCKVQSLTGRKEP